MGPGHHFPDGFAANFSLWASEGHFGGAEGGEDDDVERADQPQSNLFVEFIDEIPDALSDPGLGAPHVGSFPNGCAGCGGDEFVEVKSFLAMWPTPWVGE